MKNLIAKDSKKMSSKEIAELTGKNITHVHRDIRSMLDQLDDPDLDDEQYQELKDNRGYTSEFLLNHDLSVLLITGYDVKARLKVIQRWKELESQALNPVLPTNYLEALKALVTSEQDKQDALALVEQQKPKVQALERIERSEGDRAITDTAKIIGVSPKWLFEFMSSRGWIYKRHDGGAWVAYQVKIDSGYLDMKTVVVHNTGIDKLRQSVVVTPKGVAKLAELVARDKVLKDLGV